MELGLVPRVGIEPTLPLRENGFSSHFGFRRQRIAVRGLDYAFISERWLPSSLYTFPLPGLARR